VVESRFTLGKSVFSEGTTIAMGKSAGERQFLSPRPNSAGTNSLLRERSNMQKLGEPL
jgi:hypothetical protein